MIDYQVKRMKENHLLKYLNRMNNLVRVELIRRISLNLKDKRMLLKKNKLLILLMIIKNKMNL